MTITLRDATDADYDFCFTLTRKNMRNAFVVNWGGWSDETFKKHFVASETKIILLDGEVVGYYALSKHDDYYSLDNIQLLKEYTRQGIGSQVIGLLSNYVMMQGGSRIHLTVFVDNPALMLYKKLGFVELREKNKSLLMELVL